MSWVAKNSITGKIYGKPFDDIMKCQQYIDSELRFLQYEWTCLRNMEDSFDSEIDYQKFLDKKYKKTKGLFMTEMYARIDYAIQLMINSKSFDSAYGQHVIRCWYVEQKRFADGFDF